MRRAHVERVSKVSASKSAGGSVTRRVRNGGMEGRGLWRLEAGGEWGQTASA